MSNKTEEALDLPHGNCIMGDECGNLSALRAQGKDERAEIVAWLRNGEHGSYSHAAAILATAIEAGQHKEAGRG